MPKKFILLGAVLVLGVLGAGFVLAWTEPSQAPPEGNIPKPINEGPATQTKEGGFNTIGNMGVNITSPAHGMTVNKKAIGVGNWDGAGDTVSGLQFGNSGTEHAGIRFDGTANLFLEMASASADPDTWYDAATALNLIIRNGRLGIGITNPDNKLTLYGLASNIAGPHIKAITSADGYPVFQQLNWAHDSVGSAFDAYYDGSNWRSSDAGSNFSIYKYSDLLRFRYAGGVAQGAALTWSDAMTIAPDGKVNIFNLCLNSDCRSEWPTGGDGGVGGSGSAGGIAFWTSASNIGSDPSLFWDNTNKQLGIGTDNPDNKLTFYGTASNITSGPHIKIIGSQDSYPLFQQLNWTHDNVSLAFDAYYDGSSWRSSDAGSNFYIRKLTDALRFGYESGVSAGGAVIWSDAMYVGTNGDVTFNNNICLGGDCRNSWPSGTGGVGGTGAAGQVAFWSGSTDITGESLLFWDSSSDRLGIGIASPSETLHLGGSFRGNQSGAVRISTGYGYVDVGPKNASWSHFYTDRPRFYFQTGITVDTGNIGSYDENLSLQTSGTTRMTISNSNGHVGIGTTNPDNRITLYGLASNIAGPHIKAITSADGYPVFQQLNWAHDSVGSAFDAYYDGSNWRSSDAGSNFSIYKYSDLLRFRYAGGVAQGAALAWSDAMTINPSGEVNINSLCLGGVCYNSWPSGGGDISGSGTAGNIAKFTAAQSIGNSIIADNGTMVTVASPSSILRLQDNNSAGAAAVSYVDFYDSSARLGYIGFGSASDSNLYLSNSTAGNFIFTGGAVGIGTAGPNHDLHVYDAANHAGIRVQAGTAGKTAGIFLQDTSNTVNLYNVGSGRFDIGFAIGSGSFTLKSDGTVGINDNSPSYALDVTGDIRTTNRLILGSLATDPTGINGAMYYNTSANKFRCYQNSAWADCVGGAGGITGSGTSGQVAFWTGASSLAGDALYWNSASDRLGVGVASPGAKLHVRDDTASVRMLINTANSAGYAGITMETPGTSWFTAVENDYWQVFENNGVFVARLIIKEGGNVGIGTTAPGAKLEVAGGRVEFTNTTDATGSTNTGVLEIANALRIDGNEIITNTNTTLNLQADNNGDLAVDSDSLYVDSSANRVGIGITTPSATLHVDGAGLINGNLDMTQHEIENMLLDKRTTNPASPVEGQIWICVDDGNDCQ